MKAPKAVGRRWRVEVHGAPSPSQVRAGLRRVAQWAVKRGNEDNDLGVGVAPLAHRDLRPR